MTPKWTTPRRFLLAATAAALAIGGPFGCAGTGASQDPAARPAAFDVAGVQTVDAGVPGDPMGVTVHRLANGMTVMLSVNREEPRIDAWITIRAGGAKDPADATGMAHYLEHMQFKGTPRLGTLDWAQEKPHLDRITALYEELFGTRDPDRRKALYAEIDAENQAASQFAVPNEFDRLYDALGAQGLNAFTSNDQTSYTVSIPTNRVQQWADVETERLREPVYRLFQTELEAVYEEKNRGMDSAARVTNEALSAAVFPAHPYGTQTVLGHVEHLKNPSLTKMYEYFHRWYVPGNMCVALSGDFDKKDVLEILSRTLGTLPSKPFPDDPKFEIAPPKGVKRVEVKFKGEEEVQIAYLLPPETHPDHDALVLCDMMLANGRTGLIDVNLNQAQKVRRAGCGPNLLLEAGYQLFNASPKQGQSLGEAEALLLDQVALLKQGAFKDEDLAAVVTEFEIQKKRELESNRNRVASMTEAFIQRTPWETKVRAIDALKKVTKEQVVAAANKYFGNDYVVVHRIDAEPDLPKIPKPSFTAVKIDPTRRSPWFQEIVARPTPEIEPRFVEKGRDVETVALRSGSLVYAKNPVNDVFDLSFTIPVGTDSDPRLGMALALLDFGGAGDLDGVALKRKLYALGSTISAGASREESVVSVSGLESNLQATVDLLRLHFEKPTGVSQDDLNKLVGNAKKQRAATKKAPQGVAAALGEYAQRGKQSAFLSQPSNSTLDSWTAEELLAAARDLWRLRRTVDYVGQLPAQQVAAIVDLPPIGGTLEQISDAPPRKPVIFEKSPANRVLFVDQPTAQAQLRFFAPDGAYDRAQVPVQRVYNETMSGSMSGIVFQIIRESKSLAYDPSAGYRTPTWASDENLMIGSMGTQADKTVDAVGAMVEILRAWPGTQARFDAAIHSIDQAYRTNRVGFRRLPGTWNTWMHQGYEGDPRPWNWGQVKQMKLGTVQDWSKRFAAIPFTIAIAGPKARIDLDRLKEFGEVREMKVDDLFAW